MKDNVTSLSKEQLQNRCLSQMRASFSVTAANMRVSVTSTLRDHRKAVLFKQYNDSKNAERVCVLVVVDGDHVKVHTTISRDDDLRWMFNVDVVCNDGTVAVAGIDVAQMSDFFVAYLSRHTTAPSVRVDADAKTVREAFQSIYDGVISLDSENIFAHLEFTRKYLITDVIVSCRWYILNKCYAMTSIEEAYALKRVMSWEECLGLFFSQFQTLLGTLLESHPLMDTEITMIVDIFEGFIQRKECITFFKPGRSPADRAIFQEEEGLTLPRSDLEDAHLHSLLATRIMQRGVGHELLNIVNVKRFTDKEIKIMWSLLEDITESKDITAFKSRLASIAVSRLPEDM